MKKRSDILNSKRKKALSPVVATILLILLAIILILIFLLFSKSFIKDVVEKNEQHAKYSCEKVKLEAYLDTSDLYITNVGNVPVYKIAAKRIKTGSSKLTFSGVLVPNVQGTTGTNGLPPGNVADVSRSDLKIDNTGLSGYTKLKVIPILLGTVKGGSTREYVCPDEFSFDVDIS